MKKILIAGDSFAADWTVKYKDKGWPNLLAEVFSVTNVAEAGCGEYKILNQLLSQSLKNFDHIIVCHTSPYRIYSKCHPVHNNDSLHFNSDFIYSDIVENIAKHPDLQTVRDYFEKFFDVDYAKFIHNLICKEISATVNNLPVIHLSFFDYSDLYSFDNFYNFYDVFKTHRGDVNHLDSVGNEIVYNKIKGILHATSSIGPTSR